MSTICLTIDGRKIICEEGITILEAARQAGIDIPSLCYLKEINKAAACRVCVVKIEGMPRLMPSCATPVKEGMVIYTNTEEVKASRKKSLELLCEHHRMDCEYCPDYTFCELHAVMRREGVDDRKYSCVYKERNADESSRCIVRDPSKCIRCRRCVSTCKKLGVSAISALYRADQTTVGTEIPMRDTDCVGCGLCVRNCPTGALFIKDDTDILWRALNNHRKLVFGIMPETSRNIGRFFGAEEDRDERKRLSDVLKKAGADAVFDLTGCSGLGLEEAVATAESLISKSGSENVLLTLWPAAYTYFTAVCSAEKISDGRTGHVVKVKHPEEFFFEEAVSYYEKQHIRREELCLIYVSGDPSVKEDHVCDAVLTTTELYQWIRRACVSRFTALSVWKQAGEAEMIVPGILSGNRWNLKDTDIPVQTGESMLEAKELMKKSRGIVLILSGPGGSSCAGGQFRTRGYQKKTRRNKDDESVDDRETVGI